MQGKDRANPPRSVARCGRALEPRNPGSGAHTWLWSRAALRPLCEYHEESDVSVPNPFRDEAIEHLSRVAGLDRDSIDKAISRPPKLEMGDYAFPCFQLAKERKAAPPKIAAELAASIGSGPLELLEWAKAFGPYVNFRVRRDRFAEHVLRTALAQGDDVGRSDEGAGRVVAIDYCSPNIAKPFHVGHLRSTIIGGALYRLFELLGYRSVGINHLGDWGTQFGKQIVALQHWGRPEDIGDLQKLNDLYVRYHVEEAKPGAGEALATEAREWFRRQEAGDEEALRLWREIRETSVRYLGRIFDRLGVRFEHTLGESFYNDKMDAVIDAANASGLTSVSQGALVIDLTSHGIETPALLRKADGATLYLTRDLAAAMYRKEHFHFDKMLYVVGTAQSLHFQQLFKCLALLGHEWAADCVHVNFGLVQGMSTRKGNVIYLEDLLDEAKDRALRYMRESVDKRSEVTSEEDVAEAVGTAAILFGDLSKQRIRDYTFSWEHAISFEGDTGPYLLNAHARIAGIVRKCGIELDPNADVSPLVEDEAHELILELSRYPDVLREAAASYEPSVIANYVLALAHALHASYSKLRVKGEAPHLAQARLLLFSVVKNVLASGLRILGIRPLEAM
jgi:arginyl-tRNA synthetase